MPVRALLGPRFHKVFYDLYVDSSVEITPTVRARAALRACGESSYASHFTAAELWGGSVPQQPQTHVSVNTGTRSVRRGIRAHVAPTHARVTTFRGIPVSTPEQTFLDLAPLLQLLELVVLGDSLMRKQRTAPEDLVAAASCFHGRGARLARRAAALVRGGVDSPMESRTRLLLVLAGLPEPVVNFTLRNADGSIRMRFDLSYPEYRLIIEYDARQHARDDSQWARDIQRREELDRLGWRLLIIRAEDLYGQPEETLNRILDALRSRGAKLPRRFRPEWHQHFPVRTTAA